MEHVEAPRRSRLAFIVAGEAVAVAAAVYLMVAYDLGWVGAILLVAIISVFTAMIVRSGELRARQQGAYSPAIGRYNRRMMAASAVYVVALLAAIAIQNRWAFDGPIAFILASAPSIGVLMMVAAMGRLIVEETDEYLRFRYIRAALFGTATLLTLATIWGFFEQFELVPHAPGWMAVPVFAVGMGIAQCRSGARG